MFRNSLDHHVLKFLFVFFMYVICQKEKSATFPFLLVNHLSLVEVRLWIKEATWGELYIERHLAECFSDWPQLPWVKDKMACDLQQGNGKCGHNFSLNLELHWTSHTFVWGERKRVTNIVLLETYQAMDALFLLAKLKSRSKWWKSKHFSTSTKITGNHKSQQARAFSVYPGKLKQVLARFF